MNEDEILIVTPPVADETDPLEFSLVSLTQAISRLDPERVTHGILGGRFGYGALFENDVFSMRPDYQNAECDCGFSERAAEWHAANRHLETCYCSVRDRRIAQWQSDNNYAAVEEAARCDIFIVNGERFDGSAEEAWKSHFSQGGTFQSGRSENAERAFQEWREVRHRQLKAEDEISRSLCRELGVPWNDGRGSAVHCTCGVDGRAKEFFAANNHSPTCQLVLPNFRHKASGLEVRWYKWIGRDMKIKRPEGIDYAAVFAECVASLGPSAR